MMGKKDYSERSQVQIASLDDLVPSGHLVRKLEEAIDLSFIYDEVKDLYKPYGRESIDPVVLMKIVILQYVFGIPSMRKTIKEIEVNLAYRWYLGYGLYEDIPHFSTFGKNYTRRFKDTDLLVPTSKPVQTLINIRMKPWKKKPDVTKRSCRRK